MMQKLRKLLADFDVREKAGIITIVILVWLGVNTAFALLVNVPRAARIASLRQESQSIAVETRKKRNAVEEVRDDYARVVDGTSSLEEFYDDILSTKSERLVGFQREIREIAGKFNINLEAISYPREIYENKVTKFGAAMPLTGSYENLREFIETIEKSKNFMIIESIQLTNSRQGGVILSLNIVVSTYFLDPDITDEEARARARRG